MDHTTLLAVLGPVIALLVGQLKRIPIVAAYPKIVAAVLAVGVATVVQFVTGSTGALVASLLQIALDAFIGTGTAVLAYETVKAK